MHFDVLKKFLLAKGFVKKKFGTTALDKSRKNSTVSSEVRSVSPCFVGDSMSLTHKQTGTCALPRRNVDAPAVPFSRDRTKRSE
jgi:hypothetical protein